MTLDSLSALLAGGARVSSDGADDGEDGDASEEVVATGDTGEEEAELQVRACLSLCASVCTCVDIVSLRVCLVATVHAVTRSHSCSLHI